MFSIIFITWAQCIPLIYNNYDFEIALIILFLSGIVYIIFFLFANKYSHVYTDLFYSGELTCIAMGALLIFVGLFYSFLLV